MYVAGVRFTTLFILTHIKRFFIMFQTNYWTDVFVVRLLAGRARLSLLLYSPAQDGKHIKCFPLRAELATNLIAPPGKQAAETRSVQSNIVRTEFWLMTCSRQRLDRQPSLCPFISCDEIETEFGVESYKQSLFHRNLWEGQEKRRGLRVESSPLLQGAMLFAYRGIRPDGR